MSGNRLSDQGNRAEVSQHSPRMSEEEARETVGIIGCCLLIAALCLVFL